MTEILFSVLLQGLKLWNDKQAGKYLDKVISLQNEWLEEYAKPRTERNNSILDETESQLYMIAKLFSNISLKK